MFDFLKRFAAAEHVGAFEKHPGVTIDGAWLRDALVNVLYGPKVPQRTYTIGHNGRGSLVLAEQEFRDLLMSMIKMAEVMTPGYFEAGRPVPPHVSGSPTPVVSSSFQPAEQQAMSGPDQAGD